MNKMLVVGFIGLMQFTSSISKAEEQKTYTIDFTSILTDLDHKPLLDGDGKDPNNILTLGKISSRALCGQYPDEQTLPGDEKFKRGLLAMKIEKESKAVLTAEEISKIKLVIGKGYGALIVADAYPLLDPASSIAVKTEGQ